MNNMSPTVGLLIASLFISQLAHAKPSAAKSVTDWYAQVPNSMLEMTSDSTEKELTAAQRIKAISIRDDRNGYLEIKSDDLVCTYTVALFIRSDKTVLLGITRDSPSAQRLMFLDPGNGTDWKDITAQVMPAISTDGIIERYKTQSLLKGPLSARAIREAGNSAVNYRLPRRGTDVLGVVGFNEESYGKTLFTLHFTGMKFELMK